MIKDFLDKKKNVHKLIHFYIKEKIDKKTLSEKEKKKYNEYSEKCNEIVDYFQNKCTLLYNLDILKKNQRDHFG